MYYYLYKNTKVYLFENKFNKFLIYKFFFKIKKLLGKFSPRSEEAI